MKALIIGLGSIGKRHLEVLKKIDLIDDIHLVTKQNIPAYKTFCHLQSVDDINDYDYFIISSETARHYDDLAYLIEHIDKKIILCEKPLFNTYKEIDTKNNKVFVGYNLRFHPLLQKLKQNVQNNTVLSAYIQCGSYLPSWRPHTDYKSSYSAKKALGGGVALDLSHEIDYSLWLFGNFNEIKTYNAKISDLEIDSDDLLFLIGKTEKNSYISITLDYFSKLPVRKIILNTIDITYEFNLISNELFSQDKAGFKFYEKIDGLCRNFTYEKMHLSALTDHKDICTYDEGLMAMKVIKNIQE